MLKDLSYVSASFICINLLGYVFHFVVSRKLEPSGYGQFMVLYSLMLSVGAASSLLVPVTVKSIIENFSEREPVLRFLRVVAIGIGVIVFVSGIVLSPFIQRYLNISDVFYIWVIASVWLLIFIVSIERGYLQARNLFNVYAISTGLEFTVRLLSAVILLYLGFHIYGAILSSLIGLISTLILLLHANKYLSGGVKKIKARSMFLTAMFTAPTGFFIYADDIFIRRLFNEHTAGAFASASILGKALIWFSLSMFSVFFPKIVQHKKTDMFVKYAFKIMFLIILLFLVAEIGVVSIGKFLFFLLFGEKFTDGFNILPHYIIAILPLALSLICIGMFTALESSIVFVYLHLLAYYGGFVFFNFTAVNSYLVYIFFVNLIFLFIYAYLLLRGIRRAGLKVPVKIVNINTT